MGFANVADTVLGAIGQIGKKTMSSFNFLETTDGNTLIAKDGSLATVVRVDGIRQMMDGGEFNTMIERATSKLSPYMGQGGHAMQVYFSRDPDLSAQMLKEFMVAPRTIAKRLNLDLDDLMEERERNLPRYIVQEAMFIVLWTRLSVLTQQEMDKMKQEGKRPPFWPGMGDTQNVFALSQQMAVRHDSFVQSAVADMESLSLRLTKLDGHDALKAIRSTIYPDMTGSNWKPYLPGDLGSNRVERKGEWVPWARMPVIDPNDMSHLLWPRLDQQLFDKEAEVVNPRIVRIGRYNFAGIDMTMGPQDLYSFNTLLNRMRELKEFPWRVSFLIEGDGLSRVFLKSFLAAITSISTNSKLLRQSIKALEAYRDQGEGVVVRMRTSFATWAPSSDIDLIEERSSRLQRAVEAWGYCQTSPSAGDPLAGVMSSALALDVASTAPAGLPPLQAALSMMPWMRDASPFRKGSVLFRTPDNRPWPYQPGSSQQDTFIDLISAPPGKGKSVFLNTTNLAFCLSPDATSGSGTPKLPRVAIIDIGHSSSGLISLLKESLPANRRHEVDYRRLRMIKDHAINPFDTQLGCREPLPLERSFLVNFITILGSDPGEKAPSGLSDLAGMAVDELYSKFSDKERRGQPKRYDKGLDNDVDESIKTYNISLSEEPSWWEVTDKLFAAGDPRGASLAQRHAVPRVEDLMVIIREKQIEDVFGQAKTGNGEAMLSVFARTVSSAIREYPILTLPTRFDLGNARVISLDLDEAAPSGGGPAEKQTAIVYMLARFSVAKDFYLNDGLLQFTPEEYKSYHSDRIRDIRETPKRIVFDEFHRTKATSMVRQQVKIDMREGRKWGVQVSVASQLLEDFDDDMVKLATGYWIMGVGTDKDAEYAQELFGLSNTAKHSMINNLNGPGPGGAPFLAVLRMKDGKHEHLLFNTLGPMEMWAFSTTSEDVAIRNRLYSIMGPEKARLILAKRFPHGTAKKEVERRVVERAENSGEAVSDANKGVIDEIIGELERAAD